MRHFAINQWVFSGLVSVNNLVVHTWNFGNFGLLFYCFVALTSDLNSRLQIYKAIAVIAVLCKSNTLCFLCVSFFFNLHVPVAGLPVDVAGNGSLMWVHISKKSLGQIIPVWENTVVSSQIWQDWSKTSLLYTVWLFDSKSFSHSVTTTKIICIIFALNY